MPPTGTGFCRDLTARHPDVPEDPEPAGAYPAMWGRLSIWSGEYLEQSGGVDASGEVEKSLRQFVGGFHGGVVAHAVEGD